MAGAFYGCCTKEMTMGTQSALIAGALGSLSSFHGEADHVIRPNSMKLAHTLCPFQTKPMGKL